MSELYCNHNFFAMDIIFKSGSNSLKLPGLVLVATKITVIVFLFLHLKGLRQDILQNF